MLAVNDLKSRDYHTVVIAATDVQGRLFGRRLPVDRFVENPDEAVPICSGALAWDIAEKPVRVSFAGLHTGWHDVELKPDLESLRPYPATPGAAICFADVVDENGERLPVAPRNILRHQLERLRRLGYDLALASELEFYLFRSEVREARRRKFQDLEPTTLVRSDYSIVGQAAQEPLIQELRQEMERVGVRVRSWQAEYGLGQWEMNLQHTGALEMADCHVLFKAAVKEMALRSHLTASFMAKPVDGDAGSSCHFHCSLWSEGRPVFPQKRGSKELSTVGNHFLAGLLKRLNETAIFFAPYVNSFKRHMTADMKGTKGGHVVAWGRDNRTAPFRVVGAGDALRVEHRYAGADVNPYLAVAAMVAAGINGVEEELDPGAPVKGDAFRRAEYPRTAQCLGDALKAFESSEFVRSAFGQEVVSHYASHARSEWTDYLSSVTDWEIMRAFELA